MDRPQLAETLEEILETRLQDLHTAMPGKIISYDHALQRADVEPQLRLAGESLPVLPSVPVVWPLAYGDLSAGDTVLLIFCEGDIGLWRQQGQATQPDDDGRHGLHAAVAIAGLRPATDPLDHTSNTTVLPGSDCRLSEYDAAQAVLRANAWAAEITTAVTGFLPALALWAAAVDARAGGTPGVVLSNLTDAITAYIAGISGASPWLSTKVKVP